MAFLAEVYVSLKPVVNDPEGLTIRSALHSLGFTSVREVRSGKYIQLTLEGDDQDAAQAATQEMAKALLANQVIEDFRIQLRKIKEPASVADAAP